MYIGNYAKGLSFLYIQNLIPSPFYPRFYNMYLAAVEKKLQEESWGGKKGPGTRLRTYPCLFFVVKVKTQRLRELENTHSVIASFNIVVTAVGTFGWVLYMIHVHTLL